MQIIAEPRGKYLLLHVSGRLDASWADHFKDTMLSHIRHGHHHLVIDASGMGFLSSAGIRSLMQVHKELQSVEGDMVIIHAVDFVYKTLETTGLGFWLADSPPAGMPAADMAANAGGQNQFEVYELNPGATCRLSAPVTWRPWQAVSADHASLLSFQEHEFGLGIGSAATNFDDARQRFGEFMAVAGNVVYQPPGASERPDYLLSEKEFVPEMLAIQAILCRGEMSHLLRFAPIAEKAYFSLSEIMEAVLNQTAATAAGFVILAEVEGMVGAAMTRSPGLLQQERHIDHPEILDWLSFCGERVFARHQALIAGVTARTNKPQASPLLPPLPSRPDLCGHAHACVLPYQPLQNGRIDMKSTTQKFLGGPPPLALLHLTDDNRPAVGIGQTTLVRGACWCSPITNPEELP